MIDDKLNITDLEKEKLLLDIEELKKKFADSKKSKTWEDYIKLIIPIAVTLIITIFGWIITGQFNKAQLATTESKNKADREIAQINASLAFIGLMTEIPDSSVQIKQQAKTIIAPALPPESSFFIAINELPNNPYVLEVLLRTYKNDYWKYLTPYLEKYPFIIERTDPVMPYYKSSLPFKADLPLFSFLDKRHLLKDFYQFVISENYISDNRLFAIINYLAYFNTRKGLDNLLYGLTPAEENEIKYRLLSSIEKTSDYKLKADISKAASLVLDPYYNEQLYTELAARYFWENFDVSYGESPKEFSVEQFIYDERFHYEDQVNNQLKERDAIDTLSYSLFSKLSKLNFKSFEINRTEVVLYSYCGFGKYLRPKHISQLMEIILQSVTNYKQKQEFADYLGSLSGNELFRKISDDEEEGKKYAELLIGWYQKNWEKGWHIPEFFREVVYKYPELKTKIDKIGALGQNNIR